MKIETWIVEGMDKFAEICPYIPHLATIGQK
jgi:hypothetical protein